MRRPASRVGLTTVRGTLSMRLASRSNGPTRFRSSVSNVGSCMSGIVRLGGGRMTRTTIGGMFASGPVLGRFMSCLAMGGKSPRNFNRRPSHDSVAMSRGSRRRRVTVVGATTGRFNGTDLGSGCVGCLGSSNNLCSRTGTRLTGLRTTSGRHSRTCTRRTRTRHRRRRTRALTC